MLQIFAKSKHAAPRGNGTDADRITEGTPRGGIGKAARGLMAVALLTVLAACSSDGPSGPGRDRGSEPFPLGSPQFDIPRVPEGQRDDQYNAPHMEGRNAVRVGLLLPFSAQSAGVQQIARSLQDAAQMALFQSGSRNILLIPKDTRGTAVGAREAAEAAIEAGAEIILGPLFAENVSAAAHVAVPAAIPVVAFSSDRKVAQPGVYLLSFQAEEEIRRVVQFALSQGLETFAALVPANSYGDLSSDVLSQAVFQYGGTVTNVVAYDTESQDYRPFAKQLAEYDQRAEALKQHINKLKRHREAGTSVVVHPEGSKIQNDPENPQAPEPQGRVLSGEEIDKELARLKERETFGQPSFQAVLIPAGGTTLRSLAPLLTYFDVDNRKIRFLGTGLWDDSSLWKEPALAGGWFAAPSPEQRNAFLQSFKDIFDYRPPRLASLGYDAILLTAALSRGAERGERFTDKRLTNPSGFAGVDGIFRFRPDGSTDRGLAVLEVRAGKAEVVSPAPQRFDAEVVY